MAAVLDASAERQQKLQALMERSKQRGDEKAALQKKLMMKLYLEGLKAKTRKARAAEAQKAREPEPEAEAAVTTEFVVDVDAAALTHSLESGDAEAARECARLAAESLRRYGCARMANLAIPRETIDACVAAYEGALNATLAALDARGLDRDGVKTREIVSRNRNRFDLVAGVEGVEPFDGLGRGGPWMRAVRRALGVDCRLLKSGVVSALPGAEKQAIHADGKHLFADEADTHLPAHCVTVFVPLVDLRAALGPTEYFPATHKRDGDAAYYAAANAGRVTGVSFADAKAGDAILFDYRVLHRGLANTTEDIARPLLYFTYGRAWFTDATNYSALSIYDAAEET